MNKGRKGERKGGGAESEYREGGREGGRKSLTKLSNSVT